MRRLRGPNCLYQKQCNNCNFITDQGRAGDLSRSSHVWKCRREVKVTQSCQTLCNPNYTARGILQARKLELSSLSLLQGIFPTQGLNPGLPTLQVDSLPAEPQGKPKNTGVGLPFPSPGDLSNPGIESRSPALQADSLPAEPQGKPKNTGVGSLSPLQWIFPAQESTWGLLHCRWILYQLSYYVYLCMQI